MLLVQAKDISCHVLELFSHEKQLQDMYRADGRSVGAQDEEGAGSGIDETNTLPLSLACGLAASRIWPEV